MKYLHIQFVTQINARILIKFPYFFESPQLQIQDILMNLWKLTAALVLVTSVAYFWQASASKGQSFDEWKQEFGFSFSNQEEAFRMLIFQHNLQDIQKHNADPLNTYTKGINQFTHLNREQFRHLFAGKIFNEKSVIEHEVTAPVVGEIDWQALGKVSPVGAQGQCDAGYAFCSAGLIQSFYLIQDKNVLLSKQQIVDCSADYTTFGCQSGSRNGTLTYIREKGLTLQSDYPYKGVKNNCQKQTGEYKPVYKHVQFSGCTNIQNGLYGGPLTVAVNALDWQTYRAGIFNGCTSVEVNHDVLLVGYNAEWWRIKNSWGERWGEYGYIRLKTGNTCGICEKPAFGFAK